MPTIGSTLLPSWLSPTADLLQHNKNNIENTASDKADLDNPIQPGKKTSLDTPEYEEPATSAESSSNIASDQADNSTNTLLMKPTPQVNITLPASETAFFYQLAYREQNRLLHLLLAQENDSVNQQNKSLPAGNLINDFIDYLTKYKNDEEKIAIIIKQLLIPLNEYGSGEGEKISPERQQAIIADWLQLAVLGMSSDKWCAKQLTENKSNPISLLNYANFKKYYLDKLNSKTEFGYLSAEAKNYYQQNILHRVMPTLMLQLNTPLEDERLQNMTLDQPEWGYLHAGAMLMEENGAKLDQMLLDDIITIGMLLESLLLAGKTPAEYSRYFNLPAIIHNQLDPENIEQLIQISEQESGAIYQQYFNYLHQFSQNNPFIQLSHLLQDWQSRPELARQQLKQHDIAEDWLNDYLYKNREVEYRNNQDEITLLPNIDEIFKQQNQHIADAFKQTEYVLLPQVFNSLSEEEQLFMQQAEINQLKVEYNARDNNIHSLPPGVAGLVAEDGLIIPVPDGIDMLMCSFNGEERIYALEKDQKMGNYKLSRVDRKRDLIFNLIKDHKNTRYNKNFALKIHSPSLLKKATEQPKVALEKLAELHANKLFKKLDDEGYQKTTQQRVAAFFLSLIPFYSCITEAQKGNIREAIVAGVFDILSFLPFLGKGLQIGGRFSIAMGEATTQGLKIAAKQATIAQALKQGGKQFVSVGIPHITKSVPAEAYIGLSIDFIRSADPGFELLASGGLKGINSLKDAAIKLNQKNHHLASLVEALEKQVKNLSQTSIKSFKIETAYRPELKKEVLVVNIGKKQNKDIFVQINSVTGALYGRKYHRDAAGNLALAPVRLQERLYHLKTQGLGGKGSKMAAQNWRTEEKALSSKKIQKARNEGIRALKEILTTSNNVMDLAGKNLSYLDLARTLKGKRDFCQARLHNADLTKSNLTEVNLTKANLYNTNLTEANLSKANLTKTELTNADLTKSNLTSANLTQAKIIDAKMIAANLSEADLTHAAMMNADLAHADLCFTTMLGTQLNNAILTEAKMIGANLTNANLTQAEMNGANLTVAELIDSNLTRANLAASNLSESNLAKANLQEAKLSGARMVKTTLNESNLTKAWMMQANLTDANLTEAKMVETNLSNANLTLARMRMVDLTDANLSHANMIKTNLSQANLTNAKMNCVNLTDANLTEANMLSAKLIFAKMIKTKMVRTSLTQAKLAQAAMNGADLSQAKMIEANLTQANLTAVNMTEATLNKANLTEAKMIKANLIGANLTEANMTEANLTLADLTQAKMIKTNLTNAKLAEANMTEADLTDANLDESNMLAANLFKANLTKTWMAKSNLTHANLSAATMIATNLTRANLTGAKMMGVNLSNANLYFTKMNSVDLTEANLTQAWMTETNLTYANLTEAKMISTTLTHANLTEAKMSGANLSQAILSSAQMNSVDLTDANLADARLIGTNLAGANLSQTNLTNTNLTGANLVDTNLTDANLTGANLTNVDLSNIDLSSAILEKLEINNTNFAGANLNNTLTLALPDNWSERNLETKLNHFSHQGSLLTSIASIDDKYNELKIKLAWQLINSLKASNVDLKEVTPPLLNIFIKTPFSTDKKINSFVNQLMSEQQKHHPSNMLKILEQQAGMTNDLLGYFNQQPQLMASKELNNTFISALRTARTQGINIVNGITTDSLYEKYLNLPKIQLLVKQEEIKDVFGDYDGNADWADKHAANYLLLSPTKPGRVLIVSENILNSMLHPDWGTKWDNIVLFQDGKCLSPAEYNLAQCYQQEFPLFSVPFKYGHYQASFHKLIETLDLGERFKPLFLDALNSKSYNTKLVNDVDQQELNKIFSRVIDAESYQLKEQNYDQIINLFHLTSSSNREKAEHLFSLATIFSRYTSKVFFGTEDNSPIILRYYAYALMEKAHQIDPNLLPNKFAEWRKHLLGIEKKYNTTCTAILSDEMTLYAKDHCNDTFKKIIPPAWR